MCLKYLFREILFAIMPSKKSKKEGKKAKPGPTSEETVTHSPTSSPERPSTGMAIANNPLKRRGPMPESSGKVKKTGTPASTIFQTVNSDTSEDEVDLSVSCIH